VRNDKTWFDSGDTCILFRVGQTQASENMPAFSIKTFPYPLIKTSGSEALTEFEKQKSLGNSVPVILGTEDDIANIKGGWDKWKPSDAAAILAKTESSGEPFDIVAFRKKELEIINIMLKAQGKEEIAEDDEEVMPEMGDWPSQPEVMSGPTVSTDIMTNKALPIVYIALIPARNSTELPAYLNWGNWNANPPPEAHVAMLRKWQKLYGAEIVGMTSDVINIRVKTKPQSREEALKLASEMYHYCEDIVTQGTGDIAPLAATLMVSDYWFFWWD
jgi:Domain of unknown function (DUF4253)